MSQCKPAAQVEHSCQGPDDCQENDVVPSEVSLVTEPHIRQCTKDGCKNDSVIDTDSDKQQEKVNRGTMTERENETLPKCRYCSRRMSVLRKIDKIKYLKELHYLKLGRKYRFNKQATRNSGCQTPASLCDTAEMTYREKRNLTIIHNLQSEKSLKMEAFCKCVTNGCERDCRCGEEDECFAWVWDSMQCGDAASLKESGSLAVFHQQYSCGTTAVRGLESMENDQYFWEIKMTTPVYGTDMMIGVGTKNVELNKYHNTFCSMLGNDLDSWGISYDGRIQHGGKKRKYCRRFGQGTIIGIHLDMWHGTLTFFKNRQSLGVAFRGLRGKALYPMASSTAARSSMRVISSRTFPSCLQFLCCQRLRQLVPPHFSVLDTLPMPPGLKSFLANNMSWLLHRSHSSLPAPSSDHICQICMPLKSALEGHTEDTGSSDDERIGNILSFRDSEDDTDEEDLDDFSEGCLQRHSLTNCLLASLRSGSNRERPSSSSNLMVTRHRASIPSIDSWTPVVTHSQPSAAKKARLEASSSDDEEDNSEHEEKDGNSDGTEQRQAADLMQESHSAKQCKLGKRQHT